MARDDDDPPDGTAGAGEPPRAPAAATGAGGAAITRRAAAREAEEDAEDSADARAEELADLVVGPVTPAPHRRRFERLAGKLSESRAWSKAQYERSKENFKGFMSDRQPGLWLIALVVGLGIGTAAVIFRIGIGWVQWLWLGETSEYVIDIIRAQPWWVVFFAPVAGGFVVGLLNQYVLSGRRAGAVADIIEASAQAGRGLALGNGIWSAITTVISLGAGASAGREGPVIHLGATLATTTTRAFSYPPAAARVILACGVASGISASFNAPIAGVLFAHEVILRHYAVSAFVPIVIASVAGTLAGRLLFIGDVAAFEIPAYAIGSYWEMPAFALLGVVAAMVAITFQFALIVFDQTARSIMMPAWTRPVVGGVIMGGFGLWVPEVMGVGYEATDTALHGGFALWTMVTLVVAKILATSLSLASRFGGGIFSPALYLGAMTGGAFGMVAASQFPHLASDHGLYAILGMGAVAAALLGAPISTTVIVFELTGGYALSIALLLSVSIATGLHLAVHGRSYFHHQLETRGVVLSDGPHRFFLKTVTVATFMTELEEPASLADRGDPRAVRRYDTLETVLRVFNETGADALAVVDARNTDAVVGTVTHVQALRAYNRRLEEASVEEHR
ncbi:chloride channel protein [Acuticoccus sp. I52.16.1]|uniref:chloride channel protein n=1 Tax=Acuticoccus sp. I52.16.1 TaxID=2928472 RepID=UPI001FD54417|nr:chloride channel protein [Acuticoccus sp. I52.16.1]UOM34055.1 chloride channel protein [Acuticoccus sp. I52.16.1]